jgi:hypothetical protein
MKHKHYDMIVAWASGAIIEVFDPHMEEWEIVTEPVWYEYLQYRIKPEPKPDVVKYLIRGLVSNSSWLEFDNQTGYECVKITFDGETGKLKAAEVL